MVQNGRLIPHASYLGFGKLQTGGPVLSPEGIDAWISIPRVQQDPDLTRVSGGHSLQLAVERDQRAFCAVVLEADAIVAAEEESVGCHVQRLAHLMYV